VLVPPLQDVHSAARTSTTVALSHTRRGESRPKFQSFPAARNQTKHAASAHHKCIGDPYRGKSGGGENARAVVVNVTVTLAAFVLLSVTVAGETVHMAAGGAPAQLQVTVPLNLFAGAAATVKFAGLPATMVALDGPAETMKSGDAFPAGKPPSAISRSSRPLPISAPTNCAWATAEAARDSLMSVRKFRSKAPAPETNGALNDVPHPAEYVLNGYVVTIASPGAATHTMEFP